jgi:hypothetical protein
MDFAAIWQTWLNVLTHPEDATFEQERVKPNATLSTALIYIVIGAVVSAIFGFIGAGLTLPSQMTMVQNMLAQANLPPEAKSQLANLLTSGMMTGMAGVGGIVSIIWAPIGFLIGVGILYLIARLLGGTGDFGNYAYLIATFQAPLTIAEAIVGLVPVLGGCVVGILGIYGLVLTYFATKVAHNLTSGRAIAVILIPIGVVILLALCVAVLFVVAAVSISRQG